MDLRAQNLSRAILIMGGLQNAQKSLGLNTYQTLQQWRRNRVPAEYCPAIERATAGAVTCEELRPDVDWADRRYVPARINDCANPSPPVNCADCHHAQDCDDRRKGDRRRLETRMQISRRAEDL